MNWRWREVVFGRVWVPLALNNVGWNVLGASLSSSSIVTFSSSPASSPQPEQSYSFTQVSRQRQPCIWTHTAQGSRKPGTRVERSFHDCLSALSLLHARCHTPSIKSCVPHYLALGGFLASAGGRIGRSRRNGGNILITGLLFVIGEVDSLFGEIGII